MGEKTITVRVKGEHLEKIEASIGEMKFGKAIRKIIEHATDGGIDYLRDVLGTQDYYKKEADKL